MTRIMCLVLTITRTYITLVALKVISVAYPYVKTLIKAEWDA